MNNRYLIAIISFLFSFYPFSLLCMEQSPKSLQFLAFKASMGNAPQGNQSLEKRMKQVMPVLTETTLNPQDFFNLNPKDQGNLTKICSLYNQKKQRIEEISGSTITTYTSKNEQNELLSENNYKEIALLPEHVRKAFHDGHTITVHRTLSGQIRYVISNGITGGLIGFGLGGFAGLTGTVPGLDELVTVLVPATTSNSGLVTKLSTSLSRAIDPDTNKAPILGQFNHHYGMFYSKNDKLSSIENGFAQQIHHQLQQDIPEIASSIGHSTASQSISNFQKEIANPCYENAKKGALYGLLAGGLFGTYRGITNRHLPIITTEINKIEMHKEKTSSEKIGHIAKCTITGGIVGSVVGTAVAASNIMPSLAEAKLATIITENVTDTLHKQGNTDTITQNIVQENLNIDGYLKRVYNFAEGAVFANNLIGKVNDIGWGTEVATQESGQRSVAGAMGQHIKETMPVPIANQLVFQGYNSANSTLQDIITTEYNTTLHGAKIGVITGAGLGFMAGASTMNELGN